MLILDTCVLLWLADDQDRIPPHARDLIQANAGALYVSAISAFEIGIKCARGRLQLPLPPEEWLTRALVVHGVSECPVTSRIAVRSTALPMFHADPCDRIIIATAQLYGCAVITPDAHIRAYPEVRVEWQPVGLHS